uniref:polysaccharide pyruvyl transferase family protein n=1 Tax=Candidatus Cryptobacteroides bacterium TaxID=3085639 RepID=UPI0040251321
MRIGILTFHYACNYGAMLQTYATQEFLRSMGHDVCVVDYRNKSVEEGYAAWNFKIDLLKTLPRAFSRAMRNSRFRHLMKECLVLSKDPFDSFD